jgi:23S rRNA pseudouridine955/2504/2580 synthase
MDKSIKGITVLFENDSCLVLNKPSGLSVQGGEGVRVSLDSVLSDNYSPRPLLVHRLDKDTSGVILVAKTKEAAALFSSLFAGIASRGFDGQKNRGVIKRYLGLCSGILEQKEGAIRFDLDVREASSRTRVQKSSETFFKCLSSGGAETVPEYPEGFSFSLLELELGTGRMHQIRRHLAGIGHPLLGDDKYGDFSLNKKLRKEAGLKNLLLHASRLVIPPSPELPGGLDITAPLPDYFSRFLTLPPRLP